MKQEYYKTDLGIVVKDNTSIRLKSSYIKKVLSEEEFQNSNPSKIKKSKYLEELNIFFRNSKHEWEYNGIKFKKLDNFEVSKYSSITNYNINKNIPFHDIQQPYIGKVFIVLYHGRLYYTSIQGNYYPQMGLIDFSTKNFTGK